MNEALWSIGGDVHDGVAGGVPHIGEGILFSDAVRPLLAFAKGFELDPSGVEILTGIIV